MHVSANVCRLSAGVALMALEVVCGSEPAFDEVRLNRVGECRFTLVMG